MRSYFLECYRKLDATFPKRDKRTPDLGFRFRIFGVGFWVGNSSWIFKLGFRVGCSSWDFELDFRVRISSWISSWNFLVKISSLIFELGFRVIGLHTANLSWQTRVGKPKLVCVNGIKTVGKHVSIWRQQFANGAFINTFKFKGSILLQFFDRFVFVVWQVVFWLCYFYFRNA